MNVIFPLLLILADGVSCEVCRYQDVLDHLDLTPHNGVYVMTRPVLDYTHKTVVKLDILLYAILGVVEKTQTFTPFIWASMQWNNELISWDPAQFCGITEMSVPKDALWKPDLFIYEMIEKDDSPQNPYVVMSYDGTVSTEEEMRVVSTCKMDVYKFPFDTQECTLSIGSAIHCLNEMRILPFSNSSRATQFSREVIKSQGEWEFQQLSVSSSNLSYNDKNWELLKYTITIKRRPLLYVINLLMPVLFFLTLDIASFFISDNRGEKLSFKVTVMLAISVLLLILNEILPSTSNKTPLIDAEKQTCCSCLCRVSESEKQQELLPVAEEVISSIQSGEAHVLLSILDELKKLQETVYLHLGCREENMKFVHWAKRINRVFFFFYIITVFLFLSFIFMEWNA
ncbi:transcript variant X3 [Nothobranchius furzeri]|uniref:Transcript variant X3 n=1 Tax=Nothobranchius furzeri TaxID=105023 RepID=A0A9D3BBV0_NOTFU|nr:transcript variant X3 [Nothobranchius furzeri]